MSDIIEPTDEVAVPTERDDAAPPAHDAHEDHESPTAEHLADRMMGLIETQVKEQAGQNKRMIVLVGGAMGIVALLLAGVVGVGIQLDFFGFSGSTTGNQPGHVAAVPDIEADGIMDELDEYMALPGGEGDVDVEDDQDIEGTNVVTSAPAPQVTHAFIEQPPPSDGGSTKMAPVDMLVWELGIMGRELDLLERMERSVKDTGAEMDEALEQYQDQWQQPE